MKTMMVRALQHLTDISSHCALNVDYMDYDSDYETHTDANQGITDVDPYSGMSFTLASVTDSSRGATRYILF